VTLRRPNGHQALVVVNGISAIGAIGALVYVLTLAPRITSIEHRETKIERIIVEEVVPGTTSHGLPGPARTRASALRVILPLMHDLSRPGNGSSAAPSDGPEILMPPDMFPGRWANAAQIGRTPHEFTLDFIRIGPGGQQGVVVARVSFSPLLASSLLEQLQEHWRSYSAEM
jgi:hypothetical protein